MVLAETQPLQVGVRRSFVYAQEMLPRKVHRCFPNGRELYALLFDQCRISETIV